MLDGYLLEPGDIITLGDIPNDRSVHPEWISGMDKYARTHQVIREIYKSSTFGCSYIVYLESNHYAWNLAWFVDEADPITKEQAIINKIKFLDNKWKAQQEAKEAIPF